MCIFLSFQIFTCVFISENVLALLLDLTGELNWSDGCTCICKREGPVALEGYKRGIIITHILLFLHYLVMMLKCLAVYNSMQATDKPVAVGFGISKPEHVKQVLNLYKNKLPNVS